MKKLRIAALAAIPVLCLLLILLISDLTRSETELPILMYHHLAEEGPYNTMTVSPERFRSDMEWLRDNGFTCLLPSDLVKIRAGEMQMPDRPVMITFDDGYNSTYELAFPILKETGMKAAVALVTCVSVESDYAGWGMSWRMIREMQASGLIEFGSHTNFLHNEETAQGLTRLEGESREDYIARISEDLLLSQRLIQEHTGVPCIYLAYPYGKSDPWLVEWLRETGTFSVTTTTTTRMADLADGLIGLTRYRVSMKETPASRLAIRFMVR